MITTDAAAIEAKYGKQPVAPPRGEPPPLYAPDKQGQMPIGQPVPEGVIIEQRVGRAQAPSMMVMPPQVNQGPQPQMAIVPPSGSGKTTIGTFVEPQISKTNSNPLTAAPPATQSGIAEPPTEVKEPPKPQKKIDLTQLLLDHIHELGGAGAEACQKFYDKSPDSLKKYVKDPASIPLSCVLKFLGRRPGVMAQIAEELEPHFVANGKEGYIQSLPNRGKLNLTILTPVLGAPVLPHHWTTLYFAKKYECGFDIQADTAIWRSRNMLAKRFLESGVTWSLWLDGDIALPIGTDWFKWMSGAEAIPDEFMKYDGLDRLLSHRKAMVGGVYATRRYHGQLCIQPEIRPRSHEDRQLCNEIRRGTARGLVEVDWLGFGATLVHREVFLEIQRRFPDLAPQAEYAPWRYFQPLGDEGEDEAFCKRAKACGVPLWLDTQLICCHVGNFGFLPEHTQTMVGI